jgi:hypothetical protein
MQTYADQSSLFLTATRGTLLVSLMILVENFGFISWQRNQKLLMFLKALKILLRRSRGLLEWIKN